MKSVQDQMKVIRRGATEIIGEPDLVVRLERASREGKCLRIKAGFDPTAPDLHLGHTVLLRKLRQFQDLGHTVVFLIGDATALVGDPSGQSKTRKTMTGDEVEANTKTYVKQVAKILKTDDKKLFELRRNSEWFSKGKFAFEQFVDLAQRTTVARLLERDDFQKRLQENKPISFLELFYPLMQGYDSVILRSDVEIGGSDQKFNLLVGRELQREYGQEPQIVLTMPLLEGTDGANKMSKSLGNYIGIDESPKEIFGKIMSVSDTLMMRYYELLTDEDLEAAKALHPKEAKMKLGARIVASYHGESAAANARCEFDAVFSQSEVPCDVPAQTIAVEGEGTTLLGLLDHGVAFLHTNNTKNEMRRLIQQGAVKVNGRKTTDPNFNLTAGAEYLIQAAKRSFVKVRVTKKS